MNDSKETSALSVGGLARSGSWAVLDQAVVSGSNFLAGFLLARLLPMSDYGAYVLAFSLMLGLVGLQSALVMEPMVVFGAPMDGASFRSYFSTLTFLQLTIGLICTAGMGAGALVMRLRPHSTELGGVLLALAAAIFFIQYREFLRRALFTRLRPASVLANDLLYATALIGCIAALHAVRRLASRTATLTLGAAGLASAVWGLFQCRQWLTLCTENVTTVIRRNWAYGRWHLVMSCSHFGYSQLEIFILAAFAGLTASGGMGATRNIVAPLQVLMVAVVNVTAPRAAVLFANRGRKTMNRFLLSLSALLVFCCGAYALVVCAAPRFLLILFYRDKYSDLVVPLRLWALIYLSIAARHMFGIGLNSIRRPDLSFLAVVITSVLTVSVSFAIIPTYGITGALLARLGGEVLLLALLGYFFFKPETENRPVFLDLSVATGKPQCEAR